MGFAVANQHGAILEANDAGVGDSDFEEVGGEIFQSRLTGGDRLGVDVPVDLPELGWDLIEQFVLLHEITEFGTEDFGERLDGEKEIDFGGMPRAIGGTQSPTRDDVVDMGMILQGASPGMEHTEEAWEIGADVLWIDGEFLMASKEALNIAE